MMSQNLDFCPMWIKIKVPNQDINPPLRGQNDVSVQNKVYGQNKKPGIDIQAVTNM